MLYLLPLIPDVIKVEENKAKLGGQENASAFNLDIFLPRDVMIFLCQTVISIF